MSELVRNERRGAVALLTLNRPQALNALDRGTLEQLRTAVADVAGDAGVRTAHALERRRQELGREALESTLVLKFRHAVGKAPRAFGVLFHDEA